MWLAVSSIAAVELHLWLDVQINWAMNDKQEFIDIVETVYRGARKGRGLVVSPKGDNPLPLQIVGAGIATGMSVFLIETAQVKNWAPDECCWCRLLHQVPVLGRSCSGPKAVLQHANGSQMHSSSNMQCSMAAGATRFRQLLVASTCFAASMHVVPSLKVEL